MKEMITKAQAKSLIRAATQLSKTTGYSHAVALQRIVFMAAEVANIHKRYLK